MSTEPVVTLFTNTDIDLADVSIVDADGTTSVVHSTQNHPFWNATTGAWTPAGQLHPGDQLRTPDGHTVTVASVITWTESKLMLNLGISDLHSYYVIVGGTPVLVHNRNLIDDGTPEGIVYRRRDTTGGQKPYVGRSKSQQRFDERKKEHANPNASYEFDELVRGEPGTPLSVLEEDHIRLEGLDNLENKRHEMNEERYRANGGSCT